MIDDPYFLSLVRLVPTSAQVLQALNERGILRLQSQAPAFSVAHSLYQILTTQRISKLNQIDIYWTALERLFEPATNTQIINIPFPEGRMHATTCVSAARITRMLGTKQGEYVRMVQELTSPSLIFTVARCYKDSRLFQAKMRWLQGRIPFQVVGPQCLQIWVSPDNHALDRAVLEQQHRKYSDYDFGQKKEKNSRSATDVLLQAAVTNYALRGQYDSAIDADRVDGIGSVPFGSFGYLSLDYDIFGEEMVYVRGPAATDDDWPFLGPTVSSPLEAPDCP